MRKLIVSSTALGVFVVATPTARAVQIINVTQGNAVLFDSGGFENDTVGTAPNVASVGSWAAYYDDKVIDSSFPGPGPFAGNKYVTTRRDVNGVGGPGANFASTPSVGDQVHIEYYAYYPSGADDNLVIGSNTILGRIAGGNYLNYDGTSYNVTGLTYTPNEWQKWEVDYVIGQPNYNISVNDVDAPAGPEVWNPNVFSRVDWGHNGNDTFYLDGPQTAPPPAQFQWTSPSSGNWNVSN